MLNQVDLSATLPKEEYSAAIKPLKAKLADLQQQVKEKGLPVLILLEGWGAAGKGNLMSEIISTLDPRNFKTTSTLAPSAEELRYPFLWRHWRKTPEKGKLTILDRSWYPEVVLARFEKEITQSEAHSRLHSIKTFERQLVDDGTLLLKFFLHISKKEQKERLDKLAAKKSTSWRVSKEDLSRNKNYDKLHNRLDAMLEETNFEFSPWNIISGHDRRLATLQVYQILVTSIELALQQLAEKQHTPQEARLPLASGDFTLLQMPAVSEISLTQTMEKDEYQALLKEAQEKLHTLHSKLYLKKIPVVLVYEGWDAAGKGGNIKRLTSALDPRGYTVIPIASPSTIEKNHHYLWRFWESLDKNGHITIFDRSWYGRVMVERVEGFATPEEWSRAYQEINEFEQELCHWGAIVQKFWLHLDQDEQLRRFEARQNTPEKRWKITDEDWRNREKWPQYETAVNDMLRLTSTENAPWAIIESQNKYYARLKTINILINLLEERL